MRFDLARWRARFPRPGRETRVRPREDFRRRNPRWIFSQKPFRGGQDAAELLIARDREAQSFCERFEDGFDLMMRRSAVNKAQVHVGGRRMGKGAEEILH